jgi:coproporphyrinogen III oxidase-like Fe-S oxidoreductase
MRLLCEGGIDLAQLAQGHGQAPDIFVSALPRLAELEQGGLVTREGWGIRLTASAFDAWRDGSVGTFSQAV